MRSASKARNSCDLQGFAAGTVHPPRTGPVLPDSVPRPVPGTEDFQAATNSSSDSDAEDDGPDLSALVQGPAVPETQKDELLQKIQSSSKKHQRQVYPALSSVSINQTQSKALRHLQHDCHHSLSNHVVVCHKSTHFFKLAAFALHFLCALLLDCVPCPETIRPGAVVPEYSH